MMTFVVDTNVAIVANGCGTHAGTQCQLTCMQRLNSLVAGETVAIDDGNLILDEYKSHLNLSGRLGVGDAFIKHVFDNLYQGKRVRRVTVTPTEDDQQGFEELRENTFDRSDRKFLAVAVAAGAVVLNATDSDWEEQKELTDRLGVEVTQLCPQHALK